MKTKFLIRGPSTYIYHLSLIVFFFFFKLPPKDRSPSLCPLIQPSPAILFCQGTRRNFPARFLLLTLSDVWSVRIFIKFMCQFVRGHTNGPRAVCLYEIANGLIVFFLPIYIVRIKSTNSKRVRFFLPEHPSRVTLL